MKRADSLGIKYVMKIRADGAVALSHFEKNGQNFVKIWPRQDWIVAIVIGHTEREPYRAEKEIDKNLVPLIERKYEEVCKVVGN